MHPPLEVVTFSLGCSWGPLGGQVFVGFPLGLAWVVCFGVPPFLTPGCLWFAVGLFVPGGGRAPRASRRHGVVSCGRCLLLARALLAAGAAAFAAPTSLRCLFGGSSDQSPHTSISFGGMFRQSALTLRGCQNSWLSLTAVQPWKCAPVSPMEACITCRGVVTPLETMESLDAETQLLARNRLVMSFRLCRTAKLDLASAWKAQRSVTHSTTAPMSSTACVSARGTSQKTGRKPFASVFHG